MPSNVPTRPAVSRQRLPLRFAHVVIVGKYHAPGSRKAVDEIAHFLQDEGCAQVQGYFYGTFGAANFASEARVVGQTGSSGFYVGGEGGRHDERKENRREQDGGPEGGAPGF